MIDVLWTKSTLHEFKEERVRIGLEVLQNESIAHYVLLKPSLLRLHKLVHLSLIRYCLTLALKERSNVVSEKVIGNDEGLLAFLALLTSIGEAVGVVVVLRRCPTQDALLLQLEKVVNVVRQLLQL